MKKDLSLSPVTQENKISLTPQDSILKIDQSLSFPTIP